MASPLRIGLFPYLNVQPLIHGFRDDSSVVLEIDLPSRIADRFRKDELDLAMVPSFEAATLDAKILDSACIASDGEVETVILHHRLPLDQVKTLAVDEASRTSAALAKVLIADASGRVPRTTPFSPPGEAPPDADAVVVIGDPAFLWRAEGFARMDLGQEWRRRNQLPFVFAVMVSHPRISAAAVAGRVEQAKRRGLDAASTIAHSYNAGVDAERAEHYLRHVIRYDLGERERRGLALFHRQAEAKGLLARVKELQFHAI
jgi:chorismate dehydratase